MHDELNTTARRLGARTIQKIRRRPAMDCSSGSAIPFTTLPMSGIAEKDPCGA